jgi:hypothetical protein
LTTELVDESKSPDKLPSCQDVERDLKKVRQYEGASPRRIERHGKILQKLPISKDEFRRRGSEDGRLPVATIRALECAMRTFEPDSRTFKILDGTLNFGGALGDLTDRQMRIMDAINCLSKTTYDLYEKDVYEIFADLIRNQATSFCHDPDEAETIADLPRYLRVRYVAMLLKDRDDKLSADQRIAARELLRVLPGLSMVKDPSGRYPWVTIDRVLLGVIASKQFEWLKQYQLEHDMAAMVMTSRLFRQYPKRGETAARDFSPEARELDDMAVKGLFPPKGKAAVHWGRIPWPTRLRLRLTKRGLFFDGERPNKRFDEARRRSLMSLADVLVTIDDANAWMSLDLNWRTLNPRIKRQE